MQILNNSARLAIRLRGYLLAALAAAFYGTNPAFAVPLYKMGMNSLSVIFFRYALSLAPLFFLVILEKEGLGLKRREILPIASLGIVMAISSFTLYESYNYMNPGIASTLLFMYPILTALIMAAFFHEKFRIMTAVCLLIMAIGLYLLMIAPNGASLDLTGIILISVSSLAYALYLVMIKVSSTIKLVPTLKSLFYQILAGSLFFAAIIPAAGNMAAPPGAWAWLDIWALALLPTVFSLICTIQATETIGPTPTAIIGALEPVTAVALSILFLNETLTGREVCGGLLIILATTLEVLSVAKRKS